MDPGETATPEDGIYLVIVFNRERDEVVLTLSQGFTELSKLADTQASLPMLRVEAERLRQVLRGDLHGLDAQVDFGKGSVQAGYAAANIASKTYFIAEMPSEKQIQDDLQRMLRLYQNAVWAKKNPAGTTRQYEGESSGDTEQPTRGQVVPKEFKPKDRRDYLVQIQARTDRRKGTEHELLLAQYADLAQSLGHHPSNNKVHPRDLTLQVAGEEWLVEAKVVYNGDASQAARAAIGQLLEYSHFTYAPECQPRKMALFSEPLGEAFIALFDTLGIGVVWKGTKGWGASGLAREAGLI